MNICNNSQEATTVAEKRLRNKETKRGGEQREKKLTIKLENGNKFTSS
jgi:hypothetical protein